MDKEGTADVSPSARFGVTEATVTKKLYEGLIKLYEIEAAAGKEWEIIKHIINITIFFHI